VAHLNLIYLAGKIDFNFEITKSTSVFVLKLERENRIAFLEGSAPISVKTCDPVSAPELQALPPDALMPAISSDRSNNSDFSDAGKDTFKTVYREFPSGSPLNRISLKCVISRALR
jgi:hypothetical protein